MGIDVESLFGRRNDNRWDRTSVGDVLERVSWSTPDKDAIVATPDAVADPRYARVTYAEADRISNRVANALLALGLSRGDRVAMLCENSVEAYLTKIGIAKAGLVAVPINTMMADDMVEHMLRHVEARVAVVDADRWVDRGAPFAAAGVVPVAALRGAAAPPPGAVDFHDWITAVDDTEPDVRIHGDDIWEILPTSGTTSMPKAVMISHSYSCTAAMSHALSYTRGLDRVRPADVHLPAGGVPHRRPPVRPVGVPLRRHRAAGAQAVRGCRGRHDHRGARHLPVGRLAAVRRRGRARGDRRAGPLRPEQPRGDRLRVGGAGPGALGVAHGALRRRGALRRHLRADRGDRLPPLVAHPPPRPARAHRPGHQLRRRPDPAARVHGRRRRGALAARPPRGAG